MTADGAALQNFNQELVKCVEYLKTQSERLGQCIKICEDEKTKVEDEITSLNSRLQDINRNLIHKKKKKEDCDRILAETECGLKKILETSEILLNVVRKEATGLKIEC